VIGVLDSADQAPEDVLAGLAFATDKIATGLRGDRWKPTPG
jgi:hypothetical protein